MHDVFGKVGLWEGLGSGLGIVWELHDGLGKGGLWEGLGS